MTVLDEIASALDRYPTDETTIAIVDVAKEGNSNDTDVNELEVWKFKVRVTNNGHMNMTNVSLHILGLNGTLVSESATTGFGNDMTVADLNPVGGGGVATTRFFYFKAPPDQKPAGTELVDAHIDNYDSDWNHLFSNHTKDHETAQENGIFYPRAKYAAQVHPS